MEEPQLGDRRQQDNIKMYLNETAVSSTVSRL